MRKKSTRNIGFLRMVTRSFLHVVTHVRIKNCVQLALKTMRNYT